MNLFEWLRGDGRAVVEEGLATLKSIDASLKRIADAAEGRTPLRMVDAAPEDPELMAPMTDALALQIEAIEARHLRMGGRLPTEEELVRELAGEAPQTPEESDAALIQRLRIPAGPRDS